MIPRHFSKCMYTNGRNAQEACSTGSLKGIQSRLDCNRHCLCQSANANHERQLVSNFPMVTWQVVILGNEKDVRKEQAWAKRTCKGTFPVIGRSEFVNALLLQRLDPAASAMFVT